MLTLKDIKEQTGLTACRINDELQDLIYSSPFFFRQRTHIVLTEPFKNVYLLPKNIDYFLRWTLNGEELGSEDFYKDVKKVILVNMPTESGILCVDYVTTVIGEDKNNNEICGLQNDTDKVLIPEYLESLLLHVLSCEGEKQKAINQFIKYSHKSNDV